MHVGQHFIDCWPSEAEGFAGFVSWPLGGCGTGDVEGALADFWQYTVCIDWLCFYNCDVPG